MDQTINWFVNSRCNLTCDYCFREMDLEEKSTVPMLQLAEVLGEYGVRRVTIGGGEPLLRQDLEEILTKLKEHHIFVSLHTNGTLLLPRLERLKGLVDILSLPLDSIDEEQNKRMRGIPYVSLIENIMAAAEGTFKMAFKTTATKINEDKILSIYNLVKKTDFDYWKIYQFRPLNEASKTKDIFSLDDSSFEALRTRLETFNDPRIHIINKKQGHQPYLFLDNKGNVSTIHSTKEENILLENIRYTSLEAIGQLATAVHDYPVKEGVLFSIKWKSADMWKMKAGCYLVSNKYEGLPLYDDD